MQNKQIIENNEQGTLIPFSLFKMPVIDENKKLLLAELIKRKDERRRERLDIVDQYRKVLFTQEKVQEGIKVLAEQIYQDFKNESPLFLTVLNGGMHFSCDLKRHFIGKKWRIYEDVVKCSSYGNGMLSGQFRWDLEPKKELVAGRTIILVDDLIESGKTLKSIKDKCVELGAEKVVIVTLLDKVFHKRDINPTYTYFKLEKDKWVIGEGLDQEGDMRYESTLYYLSKKGTEIYKPMSIEHQKQDNIEEQEYSSLTYSNNI